MDYQELKELLECSGNVPVVGENENGETVTIQESVIEGEHLYKVTTYQNNGWIRDHYYHEDGTVEELFRKDNV